MDSTVPPWLQDDDREHIVAILDSGSDSFSFLAAIGGLNKAEDFRFADLAGIDFGGSDIRGFDFTGANLSRTTWFGATWDKTTITTEAELTGARGYSPDGPTIETDIPARLDRLPFSWYHWRIVFALCVIWILYGFEVTLAFAFSGAWPEISAYLGGQILGAVLFGWLTDLYGRKTLLLGTILVYFVATLFTALFPFGSVYFVLCRFAAGLGIGGEYVAINSAILELFPARWRGSTVLGINGSFWAGGMVGGLGMWLLLDPSAGWVVAGTELGWRLAIFIGAVLAAVMIVMRRWIPESPRWLLTRNREREAARVVEDMEKACGRVPHVELEKISVGRFSPRLREIWHRDKMRVVVAVFLMAASAFFYNGVFSIFHKVLHDLYGLAPDQIGWYLMIFAGGNLAGPLMLGWCFDKYGRRLMISLTYVLSGILLVGSGFVIEYGDRTVVEPTIIAWTVTFFFASAAASSAHLTAGETFPLTVRVRMIALCVAIAAFVGMVGPPIFDGLVDTKQHAGVFEGYFLATLFMVAAGCIEWFYGVDAERKTLVWRLRLPVRSRCAQTRPRV